MIRRDPPTALALLASASVIAAFVGGWHSVQPQLDSCAIPTSTTNLRFAVIGDYGLAGPPESDVASQVRSWSPDLVLTAGDNNYFSGEASTIDANVGQYYHDFICPYAGTFGAGAGTNKFFPALGNHDWVAPNAQPYLDYFSLPGNERYYDFTQGPVHFYILDSDANEPDGITESSTQAAWLRAALAVSTSPWDIVLLHHAPFSSSSAHGSNPALQWPYQQWGAEAVIAGHDHTYERLVVDGFPYFVDGLGGSTKYSFGSPLPGSQVRYSADYGAMLVTASQSRLQFRFITRLGAVIDDYVLSKPSVPLQSSALHLQLVAGGATAPVIIANAGDGSGRLFIGEQSGRIRVLTNGAYLPTPFLNVSSLLKSGGEQGLLSVAFHPDYATNGLFYVAYTAPRAGDSVGSNLVLERFAVSAGDPNVADLASGTILLTIPHPSQSNHNGGTLAFGPDGYLYWSTGDGGGGGDPYENAQNRAVLLGKILRLDVDSGAPYGIPADNPFIGDPDPAVRSEIWAYGLRNPWRMAFDRGLGDLYIGDVGQGSWEEIDFQLADSSGGQNYGWDEYEANACYEGPCGPAGKVFPVTSYDHSLGCSVTGGYVYRGAAFPSLLGRYFYGDYCSGRIFQLYNDPPSGWTSAQLLDTSYSISTFGEDDAGELYLADYAAGNIYRLTYDEPTVTVKIGGALQGSYYVASATGTVVSYPNLQDGPVEVLSTSGSPILTSQRGFWGTYSTFNEVMGYPDNQLTNHYWFPWYDMINMTTWILVGNPSSSQTAHVT
ncbi:MAG TPA: PQQ-dependent sugar dehydrogenase, partial [Anaerolineales bacterium]